MAYTDIDKPSDYFDTKLYTGNGTAIGSGGQTISGLDFQPNWSWGKTRDDAQGHRLVDSVTGTSKQLHSNNTNAQTDDTEGLTSFTSSGFTVGSDVGWNKSGKSIVAWNWKAGTSFTNDASSTGIGSIDSAGSFNNDSGFSIVSYTGNNTSGATLKHGLNTAPAMVIVKNRNRTDNRDWVVYHQKLTSASYYIYLNSTDAMAGAYANFWNNTAPNSSVITLGSGDTSTNGNGDTYIAYCFAEKKGYSKFGSYTGNGNANGTFVYTGFKPAFVMVKNSTASGTSWEIYDNKRDGFNNQNRRLFPNKSDAEPSAQDRLAILSNGFKILTSASHLGSSGASYIYMAFAENPFVTSTGVPATAR